MSVNNIIFFDFDMFGRTDDNGNILVYKNEDALQNSIRMWFASRTGDRLRRPNDGGFLDFQVSKPMDENRKSNLKDRIVRALEDDFNGIFEVLRLDLTPIYENKALDVNLIVSVASIDSEFSLNLKMKTYN